MVAGCSYPSGNSGGGPGGSWWYCPLSPFALAKGDDYTISVVVGNPGGSGNGGGNTGVDKHIYHHRIHHYSNRKRW